MHPHSGVFLNGQPTTHVKPHLVKFQQEQTVTESLEFAAASGGPLVLKGAV